jgi:hypothetical protein
LHVLLSQTDLDLVNLGPDALVDALADPVALLGPLLELLVGVAHGAAVGVVQDHDLGQLHHRVQGDDVAEGVADVAASIAVDDDLCRVLDVDSEHGKDVVRLFERTTGLEVEDLLRGATRIAAGHYATNVSVLWEWGVSVKDLWSRRLTEERPREVDLSVMLALINVHERRMLDSPALH